MVYLMWSLWVHIYFLFGKSRTVACSPGPAYCINTINPLFSNATFSVILLALSDTSYRFKIADMPHLEKTVTELLLIPC